MSAVEYTHVGEGLDGKPVLLQKGNFGTLPIYPLRFATVHALDEKTAKRIQTAWRESGQS